MITITFNSRLEAIITETMPNGKKIISVWVERLQKNGGVKWEIK